MNTNLIEGLREVLRTAIMAVIPTILYDLQSSVFHWQTWALSFVIALLSGVDKWLHKADKGLNDGRGLTGI